VRQYRAYCCTDVAVDVSFVQGVVRRNVLVQIPDSYRVVAGTSDETPGWHPADGVWTSRIHLDAPDAGRVVEKGMRLADSSDIPHIPNVDAVVVVDAGQLVVSLVERQGDRVRILGVWWMPGHVTAKTRKKAEICSEMGSSRNVSRVT